MNNGMAPGQAIDKAFKRAEAIFAKDQLVQGREGSLNSQGLRPILPAATV